MQYVLGLVRLRQAYRVFRTNGRGFFWSRTRLPLLIEDGLCFQMMCLSVMLKRRRRSHYHLVCGFSTITGPMSSGTFGSEPLKSVIWRLEYGIRQRWLHVVFVIPHGGKEWPKCSRWCDMWRIRFGLSQYANCTIQ